MFDDLVGNERVKEVLRRMLRQGRVPGALLFTGEAGLGKSLFALELARAINCRTPRGVDACGKCPSCTRTGKFVFPAHDDRDAHKKVVWSEHKDVGMLRPYNRNILVDAVRDLETESNFRPAEGRARVFLIEGAERLNDSSSNALLKTLEETPPTTHIILITDRHAGLLQTIRSRCQVIRFAPLGVDELEKHLVENRIRAGEEARLAAHLASGRPGLAIELNLDDYRARREWALGIVEALVESGDRAKLLRAAEELSDAKSKDEFEPRLDALETLTRDIWILSNDGANARIVNYDMRERLDALSRKLRPTRAASWMARVEELRGKLEVNVNRRVAADALLLAMSFD